MTKWDKKDERKRHADRISFGRIVWEYTEKLAFAGWEWDCLVRNLGWASGDQVYVVCTVLQHIC